jgi:hypothetical protein
VIVPYIPTEPPVKTAGSLIASRGGARYDRRESARPAGVAIASARRRARQERIIRMKWTRRAPAFLAALVLCLAPDVAGSLPNFSGTWLIDKTRSAIQSERPFASFASYGVITLVIDHRDPELKIEQHASMKITQRTLVSTYYTDGREASNRGLRGEAITSKSHWDKGTVVTDLRIVRGQGARAQTFSRRDVMSLSEDGKSLVMDSTRTEKGQDKPDVAHLVFLKQ